MKLGPAVQRARELLRGRRRAVLGLGAAGLAVVLAVWMLAGDGVRRAKEVVQLALEPGSLARVEGHAETIRAVAGEFELDPCLIAGIVYVESRGKVGAVSPADALGLMQLTDAAVSDGAKALSIPLPTREELLSDAALNLRLGARHFAWTLEHEEDEVERALCAYNAGRGRLRRWIEEAGSYTRWREKQLRDGDSGVFQYAQKVLAHAEVFRERGVISGEVPALPPDDDATPPSPSGT